MSKETLTPWTIDEYFNEITIRDNNKDFVLNMRLTIDAKKKRNNAQLILKACNNHDRLVEALEESKIVFQEYGMIGRVNKIEQLLTEIKQ